MNMKNKNTIIFFAILFFNLLVSSAVGHSQENTVKSERVRTSSSNIDSVMKTLDETLKENRQLYTQVEAMQNLIQNLTKEGNIIKSQLRKFEKDSEKEKFDGEKKVDELQQQLESSKDDLQTIETEYDILETQYLNVSSERDDTIEINEKLKDTLGKTILDSEKESYVKMFEEAREATNSAIRDISRAELAKEEMRAELAIVHFKMGNFFYEMKEYDKAIPHYERVLQLDPSHSYAFHNLGIIYDYYLNDQDKAMFNYNKYLKLKPVDEKAKEIRERVLDIDLKKAITPGEPLKRDYDRYKNIYR